MKKLLLMILFLTTTLAISQANNYNSNRKLSDIQIVDKWHAKGTVEMIIFESTTDGYVKSMVEIKKVLNFYKKDFDYPDSDKTILSPLAKGLDDTKNIVKTVNDETSKIDKQWKAPNGKLIIWGCNIKGIKILIL